jgi:hypothetical protein
MSHIFSLCMKKLNVNQILHDDTNVASNVKNYDKLGNIFSTSMGFYYSKMFHFKHYNGFSHGYNASNVRLTIEM